MAITFFIITIYLASVESFSYWSFAHICEKVSKIQPPSTNSNPTTSVVHPVRCFWISTAREHIVPRTICGRDRTTPIMPMAKISIIAAALICVQRTVMYLFRRSHYRLSATRVKAHRFVHIGLTQNNIKTDVTFLVHIHCDKTAGLYEVTRFIEFHQSLQY